MEFPAEPVMIGDAPVTEVARHSTPAGVVRLLMTTDSVKDRLAAFLHWNDRQGVEQAVQIIRRQAVDLGKVESWALSEPGEARERYALVRDRWLQAMAPSNGYSCGKRSDGVQIVLALGVTPEGLPLAYEELAGNTSGKTTLRDFLAKARCRCCALCSADLWGWRLFGSTSGRVLCLESAKLG